MNPVYSEKPPKNSGVTSTVRSLFSRSTSGSPQVASTPVGTPYFQQSQVASPPGGTPYIQQSQPSKPRRKRKAVIFHWISHFLSALWIAPIAVLLYLNYSSFVIGASVWCPNRDCNAESTGENAIEKAAKFDKQDHDVNGALQFVAKALEVWFMFIATSLIFDIGMMFAKYGQGLPVGYMLAHLEFGDIRYLINPLLWTSPIPHRKAPREKNLRVVKLYLFAIATAILTILANLMGPAAAVLVLPTLQWVETKHVMDQTFNGTASADYPRGDFLFPGCSDAQLLAGNYSCTLDTYGPQLDALASFQQSSSKQFNNNSGVVILPSSQEAALQMTLNLTQGEAIWVPTRRVLRQLSYEFVKTRGLLTTADPPEYPDKAFNNSLQTLLQRQGPAIGVLAYCYNGTAQVVQIDDDRRIRCYTGYFADTETTYTKCYRDGLGFSENNLETSFLLENLDLHVLDLNTSVSAFFSDKATYYNDDTDFGSGIKDCLNDPINTDCDWDKIFDAELPHELRNMSRNVGRVSYQIPGSANNMSRVYCDHVAWSGFPTYSADTSPRSNIQNFVVLDDTPPLANESTPLVVNPTWYLAAWSVDFRNDSILDGNRQIVKQLSTALSTAFANNVDEATLESSTLDFVFLHLYALGQSYSMIDYYNYSAPANPDSPAAKAQLHDPIHPVFVTYAKTRVWAWGITGRTPKMGVIVAIMGCVAVVLRVILGIATGIQERSSVELLAAAFEHNHRGEFAGLDEEGSMAKVRYEVIEDNEGRHRFVPDRNSSYNTVPTRAW
ncbi:MAG: hypothetical protein LQ342_003336 [Letrouitia transgressa]|nr:MAG: hypothetical protein LQ342_003336 [Letrouitia transgressa]